MPSVPNGASRRSGGAASSKAAERSLEEALGAGSTGKGAPGAAAHQDPFRAGGPDAVRRNLQVRTYFSKIFT